MIGTKLAHFEITDRLGAGGMGEVYRARDTRLERDVALKVLPADLADDPERLERLVREAKALAALDHPHIVTVFSVEEADGIHFLTMAYVEGRTLDELIPDRGLPVGELLDFAVPLADALRAAHERGIVHRDLKPANVMVDDEGRLRVLDFGLAKRNVALGGELSQVTTQGLTEQMTREGTILGSYPYMSPEQAEGRAVDARSDIFSLGTLLYEMTSGRRPFEGATGIGLITAILRDEPVPLGERRPDLPARLGAIVARCLEKDPQARYSSAAELRDALAELRDAAWRGRAGGGATPDASRAPDPAPSAGSRPVEPTVEPRESPPSRARRDFYRQLAIAVILVAAVLGSFWVIRTRQQPPPEEEATGAATISTIAVLPVTNLTGDPDKEYLADGMTEALITDLSKIGALKVIGRSSVMRYKGTDTPASEIAATLGVDAVLEGALLLEGDRVGVSATLIEGATDTSLWSQRFERDMTGILTLQADVARAVADEIRVALTPAERGRLAKARAVDPAAYEAYLRGQTHLERFTPRDFELALQYFDAALEIDPAYALAHVGRASVWSYRNQFGLLPPREASPRVMEAAERALALDPTLPQAHFALAAWKIWHEFDWETGETLLERAIELNPSYAEARIFYSHLLAFLGRAGESRVQAERALELSPLNPFFQGLYGIQLAMTEGYEAGIAQIRRTREMAPGFDFGRLPLASFLAAVGETEEALSEVRLHYAGLGDAEIVAALDRGHTEGGYRGAMRAGAEVITRRSESQWVLPTTISIFHEQAGELERAVEWLERGLEARDPEMPYIGALRSTEALADRRGYLELLRRMGLPLIPHS